MARNFHLPKIYPITDRKVSGLSHEEQLFKLIEGGAQVVQIRDKTASSRAIFDSVKASLKIARENEVKLIVNDRVDIALILKADGVHLGQTDLPPRQARKILGEDAIIGLSTHRLEQAIAAVTQPVDYIAYGPVFETRSKADHERVVGLEELARVRERIGDFPLVAIGGIDLENLEHVFAAGARSAAMISAIIGNGEICNNLLRATEKADTSRLR